jgi:hypothetical protein
VLGREGVEPQGLKMNTRQSPAKGGPERGIHVNSLELGWPSHPLPIPCARSTRGHRDTLP